MAKKGMRNANGFGSVVYLGERRRKPYGARVTVLYEFNEETNKATQKYKYLGFFKTRQEAMICLANYKQNPYDLDTQSITFKEVYEKWTEMYFQNISYSASRTVKSAFKYCEPLYDRPMRSLTTTDLERTIIDADVGDATKSRMKSVFNLMYKYAIAHDMVDKNYAQLCFVATKTPFTRESEKEITIFTKDEIKKLWDNLNVPFVDMVLIGIYSGWRPQELATLKVKGIDLSECTMFGGMKTDAGKNRYVPIHTALQGLIKARYDEAIHLDSEYLFNDLDGQQGCYMTYDKYRRRFEKVMAKLGMKHRPHETRHTFITLAKEYEVDEYAIKLIVGHAIQDVTEKTYTHRQIEELKKEIEKIKKG